ncbi:hypothetical protein [Bartonella phoceensis]|nr:hypothetical protein [Bartonella phoceensis]
MPNLGKAKYGAINLVSNRMSKTSDESSKVKRGKSSIRFALDWWAEE